MLNIGEIVQTVKSIVETRIGLIKQEIQDEFVGILSRLMLLIVIGGLVGLAFLFLSLSLAFYISLVTQNTYLGFLIVALMYLLIVMVLFISRDSMGFQDKINTSLKNFIFRINNKSNDDE